MEQLIQLILSIVISFKQVDYTQDMAINAIEQITKETKIEEIDENLFYYLGTDRRVVALLSKVVFVESNLESNYGQQLVVHTILNRKKYPGYGDNVKEVVFAPYQFDGVNLDSFGRYTGVNIKNVLKAILERKLGTLDEIEETTLYFNNPKNINPERYAKRFELRILLQEGDHVFFTKVFK